LRTLERRPDATHQGFVAKLILDPLQGGLLCSWRNDPSTAGECNEFRASSIGAQGGLDASTEDIAHRTRRQLREILHQSPHRALQLGKLLLLIAEPITGNSSRRLPLPTIGAGRGVTRNTSSSRKVPPPPASSAETGTVSGGSGRPSAPRRSKGIEPSLPLS